MKHWHHKARFARAVARYVPRPIGVLYIHHGDQWKRIGSAYDFKIQYENDFSDHYVARPGRVVAEGTLTIQPSIKGSDPWR